MKNVAILGSTGSIGTQTLDIVRLSRDIKVTALSCGRNIELLEAQIKEFQPELACVEDEKDANILKNKISGSKTEIIWGMEGLIRIARDKGNDTIVTAIVGMIGLRPTIAAINAGKTICLANKETLVTAGHIIMPLAREKGVDILPVDSEHSAIFQSLEGRKGNAIKHILLTASGGPFRGYTREQLKAVTLKDALKHPNWSMGKKITIDSATMVNKGLEVIEARWLFDVKPENIRVVVHPQSILHSAVEYADGGIIGQMGIPDMHLPISYALNYPRRIDLKMEPLDLTKLGTLTFEEPDMEVFIGLKMAFEAIAKGGNMPTVYNASNEKAVDLFLREKISFTEITDIIRKDMDSVPFISNPGVDDIITTQERVMAI